MNRSGPSGEDLIAPCGMNCALCWAYQAKQQYDLKKEGIQPQVLPGLHPARRALHCTWRSACETVGKGLVCAFVLSARQFPCDRLKQAGQAISHEVPHVHDRQLAHDSRDMGIGRVPRRSGGQHGAAKHAASILSAATTVCAYPAIWMC